MNCLMAILNRAKELSKNATPGPWKYSPADKNDDWIVYNSEFTFVKQDDSGVPVSKEDGEFIAEARTLLPVLAESVEILLEALDFYANKESWTINEDYDGYINEGWIDLDDVEYPEKIKNTFSGYGYGGKRARAATKKVNDLCQAQPILHTQERRFRRALVLE